MAKTIRYTKAKVGWAYIIDGHFIELVAGQEVAYPESITEISFLNRTAALVQYERDYPERYAQMMEGEIQP